MTTKTCHAFTWVEKAFCVLFMHWLTPMIHVLTAMTSCLCLYLGGRAHHVYTRPVGMQSDTCRVWEADSHLIICFYLDRLNNVSCRGRLGGCSNQPGSHHLNWKWDSTIHSCMPRIGAILWLNNNLKKMYFIWFVCICEINCCSQLLLCSNKLGDSFLSLASGWQTGFQHFYWRNMSFREEYFIVSHWLDVCSTIIALNPLKVNVKPPENQTSSGLKNTWKNENTIIRVKCPSPIKRKKPQRNDKQHFCQRGGQRGPPSQARTVLH